MDRIQEAVSRKKESREAPAPRTDAGAASPRPASGSTSLPAFREITCDRSAIGRHRIIANEQDPALNAYRVLRTRTLQAMERNGWRTLAVVSATSGAGKTVTAINLAIAIGSKAGSRSTLIDLDFYRPSVARYLGIQDPPSSLDYFEGTRTLPEVSVKIDLANTLLVANERVTRRGAEHLTTAKADEMIRTAVEDYGSRAVIFDISPILGCDDAIAFLPKVDCALIVAASGHTRARDLTEARRLLKDVNVIGTVLNKAPDITAANAYY
ncbi:MAG: P-loop NTPase [Alphaproteobacteria bacterium]|nr:P-loop NTPase [Alphaproteobacteria bacterium]